MVLDLQALFMLLCLLLSSKYIFENVGCNRTNSKRFNS